MKLAVSLFKFKKTNLKKLVEYLKNILIIIFLILIISVLTTLTLKTKKGTIYMIGLASNFSKRENIDVEVKDFVKVYPVFNSSNYLLAKNIKQNNVIKEKTKDVNITSEFDVSQIDTFNLLDVYKKPNLKVTSNNSYDRISIYGITMLNYASNKNIKYEELFDNNIIVTKEDNPILIYCTHTSESYANSERYKFNYSGTYRTRDSRYNVLSVADVLNTALLERNLKVIFDTTPHDYTSYENSYKNSKKTLQKQLASNLDFGMIIDLHRDASSNLQYAPTININGNKVAQLMIVMGIGTKGYENNYWYENLSLAVQIMRMGERMYPGLFKPMIIRNSKYNQDLAKHSFLIEIGASR